MDLEFYLDAKNRNFMLMYLVLAVTLLIRVGQEQAFAAARIWGNRSAKGPPIHAARVTIPPPPLSVC